MKSFWGTGLGWRRLVVFLMAGLVFACAQPVYTPRPLPPPPPPAAPEPPPQRPVYYVNAGRLNLRAGPGMDFPKISTLERNEAVEKLGETEDWFQVRVKKDGALGWVASRYLSATPVPAPPEVPVTPPAVVTPPPPAPIPAPIPETTPAVKPPLPEKPKPAKPEMAAPKPSKPAEAAEPPARKPEKKAEEKPAPAEKPAAPKEEPSGPPPAPPGEKPSRIRIM